MPAYFASDIHLRTDRPDRGRRLARWLDRVSPADPVVLAGDVCDFWFAARQRGRDPLRCPGLRALADFAARGGHVAILPGNHDAWLGPFYEERLGARPVGEPHEVEAHGRRVHLVHGHLLGARSAWKARMEGRDFLDTFGALPLPAAVLLEALLLGVNEARRPASDRRHLAIYRRYVDELPGPADLVVLGHIHRTLDERRPNGARMVVLGSWQREASYLRIDDDGTATPVVERD